jgi:ferredoxin
MENVVSSSILALAIAVLLTIGLVIKIGVISLSVGAFYFLFGKKKLTVLQTGHGANGFAFAFEWNAAREPISINQIQVRLYNPFGSPTEIEVTRELKPQKDNFGIDVDMGPGFAKLLSVDGFDDASVTITLFSKEGVTTVFNMKAFAFKSKMEDSKQTVAVWELENKSEPSKVFYHTVSKSFIAEPIPASGNKTLKIASNPEFAGEFAAGAAGAVTEAVENFSVSKVWIEDGCIVCDACEDIYEEVFEVTADSCIIRDGAPLDDGLKILEAAEACPVEVIKFNRA